VPRSGIEYSAELEWRFAARWAGYRLEEFFALDGEEQSAIVASYRIQNQVEAVLSLEQIRELRRGKKR